ncbi:hypothetical protein BT96DRAFT_949806 [Gymnopus androsaceus JB14]|uniref:Uncharacterized protein n=1 Tax=Gymnopus androsaceus JB14 TaxID=1447944 RepID=A0A6A4GIJ2_9AGAR|nr:hypothetical protein BT96DRAFT_949806 [Gymnopus androsaceus JB14]
MDKNNFIVTMGNGHQTYLMTEAQEKLPGLMKELKDKKRSLLHMERALGVDQMNTYQHLASSQENPAMRQVESLKIQMGLCRACSMAVRRQQYNERKIQGHTEDSVKCHEPSITKLAKEYNSLCEKMCVLIGRQSAPRNAVATEPIPLKELFVLDVDDAVWQDCEEELHWLQREHQSLFEWLEKEWTVLQRAIQEVMALAMQDMPEDMQLPKWAPPIEELDAMECDLGSEPIEEQDNDDELTSSKESDLDVLDPGLLERLDALEVADWAELELDGDVFF